MGIEFLISVNFDLIRETDFHLYESTNYSVRYYPFINTFIVVHLTSDKVLYSVDFNDIVEFMKLGFITVTKILK